jgi:hypothetical protein
VYSSGRTYDIILVAFSSLTVRESTAGDRVECSISDSTTFDPAWEQELRSPGSPGSIGMLSGARSFTKAAGESLTISLVCRHTGSGSTDSGIVDPTLTLIEMPAS